jgi:hypothetical protein
MEPFAVFLERAKIQNKKVPAQTILNRWRDLQATLRWRFERVYTKHGELFEQYEASLCFYQNTVRTLK